MRRILLALAAALTLAGCAGERVWAPDDQVAAAAYVHDGPPSVTLYTVVRKQDGSGGHSAIMVNAGQRVIFDPAGTWRHPRLPERNDVHFGMTPRMVAFYIDYHARESWDVIEQTVIVPPEVAAAVMRRAQEYGAVPKVQCALATSAVLRGVPGFESLPSTWSPIRLSEAFGRLPGATYRRITDDDDDENHGVLMVQAGYTAAD